MFCLISNSQYFTFRKLKDCYENLIVWKYKRQDDSDLDELCRKEVLLYDKYFSAKKGESTFCEHFNIMNLEHVTMFKTNKRTPFDYFSNLGAILILTSN